jgi:hypothetical protein
MIMALPEWAEADGIYTLFYKGYHALTKQPVEIVSAVITAMGVQNYGPLKGHILYKLTLYYELKKGTRAYERRVTNGISKPGPDGRHYRKVERGGLSLSEAQLLACVHLPCDEGELDREASEQGWGHREYTDTVEHAERQQELEIAAHQFRDFHKAQKIMADLNQFMRKGGGLS